MDTIAYKIIKTKAKINTTETITRLDFVNNNWIAVNKNSTTIASQKFSNMTIKVETRNYYKLMNYSEEMQLQSQWIQTTINHIKKGKIDQIHSHSVDENKVLQQKHDIKVKYRN
jgi:hypothetical protein